MAEQSNADLIAEARDFVQMGSGINVMEADRLIEELSRELEAADQRATEYAAVIEKAEDFVTRHYLDTRFGDEVLPILATAPADVLREVKAAAWDEGAGDMAEHIDNGAWWEIQNPYQEGQS